MITVKIRYRTKLNTVLYFDVLSTALEKVRAVLDVGDSYKMYDGNTLLASGKIEDYKENFE